MEIITFIEFTVWLTMAFIFGGIVGYGIKSNSQHKKS